MSALTESQVSRRDFLKGSGALVVAFGVPSLRTAAATAATGRAGAIGPALVDPDLIDSWISIGGNGRVRILVGKVELGTGLTTAQAQIAADELDVAVSSVDVASWATRGARPTRARRPGANR